MQVVGHRVCGPFSLYSHIVTLPEGSRFGPDVVESGFQSLEATGEMTLTEISSLRRNLCFAVSSHSFFSCGAHSHFLWETPGIVIFTLLPKEEPWARRGSGTGITQTRNPLPLVSLQTCRASPVISELLSHPPATFSSPSDLAPFLPARLLHGTRLCPREACLAFSFPFRLEPSCLGLNPSSTIY